ncbi:uncharacterized protein LOC128239961 [Mya arenaria]|uniref:uncharacterized protein LOC128239961 n=1 Tax=Mya arenaria TaxID=6604 RepID=UPI0022E2B69D|nr:uncharacterized protein LOC128239961 [Mya arenaria]
MASAGEVKGVYVDLQLIVKIDPIRSKKEKRTDLELKQCVYSIVEENIVGLENYFKKTLQFHCVHLAQNKVSSSERLIFVVHDSGELEDLRKICSPHGHKQNDFSFFMTLFFKETKLPVRCRLPVDTTITFLVEMKKNDLEKAMNNLEGANTRKKDEYRSGVDSNPQGATVYNQDETTSGQSEVSTVASKIAHYERINQSLPDEGVCVIKEFVVYVPDEVKLQSVRIKSHDIKKMNVELLPLSTIKGIYAVSMVLPAQHTDGKYKYVLTQRKDYIFRLVSIDNVISSKDFYIKEQRVQRDILDDIFPIGDTILVHLKDILVNASSFENIQDVCMQAEQLCFSCPIANVGDIVKSLIQDIHYYDSDTLAIAALAIGILYKIASSSVLFHLKPDDAAKLAHALTSKQLTVFPTSCTGTVLDFSKALYKVIYGEQFSICLYIRKCSHFLGEKGAVAVFDDNLKHPRKSEPLALDDQDDEAKTLFNILVSSNTDETCLIEKLLRHLPFNLALQAFNQYWHVLTNDRGPKEAIKTRVRAQIACVKKSKDLIKLFELSVQIENFVCQSDCIFGDEIETSVIACIERNVSTTQTIKQHLLNFLNNCSCFRSVDAQCKLIEAVAQSPTAEYRAQFLTLMTVERFVQAYQTIPAAIYVTLIEQELKHAPRATNKVTLAITTVYAMLSNDLVIERQDVHESMEQLVKKELEEYSIKDSIKAISSIEHMLEQYEILDTIFSCNFKDKLKSFSKQPLDILQMFTEQMESHQLDSRLQARFVCLVIDHFFQQKLDYNPYVTFKHILKSSRFWENIDKVSGNMAEIVQSNATVKHIMQDLKSVGKALLEREASIQFLADLRLFDGNTKRLLGICGLTNEEINSIPVMIREFEAGLKKTCDSVVDVLESLNKMGKTLPVQGLPTVLKYMKRCQKKVNLKQLSLKECHSQKWLWGDYQTFPEMCVRLQSIVSSQMFWNVSLDSTCKLYGTNLTSKDFLDEAGTSIDVLLSIRHLFETEDNRSELSGDECLQRVSEFVKCMKDVGEKVYLEAWKSLEDDGKKITISKVMNMFENTNVLNEVTIIERHTSKRLNQHVRETLLRLAKMESVRVSVNTIQRFLHLFKLDTSSSGEIQSAFDSFHRLNKSQVLQETFETIQRDLDTIFQLVGILTEDAINIMGELTKSTQLVEFINEIELDDVRNLIDAVEDISESHVQESTVSALIETKKFLLPLLVTTSEEHDCKWVLHTLRKQVENLQAHAPIFPAKIAECSDNLHNLKSLYNNVANRGQQTRDIIKSIVSKGRFVFESVPHSSAVLMEVKYKENKIKFVKQESTFSDIRSRALLLLNSERKTTDSVVHHDEFKKFVNVFDTCLEIKETLIALKLSGHTKYTKYKQKLETTELSHERARLNQELCEWTLLLKEIRREFYLINFIHGCDIHILYEFLENGQRASDVDMLLKFIHPDICQHHFNDSYTEMKETCCHFLRHIGMSLHHTFEKLCLCLPRRLIKTDDELNQNMTEMVHEGKLLVANLDENSEFVIRTILALYQNTNGMMPEPNQLLLCSHETAWNEIELLLTRCQGAYSFFGESPLYCLANVENLSNELQFHLVKELREFSTMSHFRLAIVCRGSKNHPFVDQLSGYLCKIHPVSEKTSSTIFRQFCPEVRTYTSEVAGLGKSTKISEQAQSKTKGVLSLHISGLSPKKDLIENLKQLHVKPYHVLHLDVGSVEQTQELDLFIFELIIMKYISVGSHSFFLTTNNVCIELANTINNTLRNRMHTATLFQRVHMTWTNFSDFIVSQEINSPIQVVCHYLQALEQNALDRQEIRLHGHNKMPPLSEQQCRTLLQNSFGMTSDISFSIVHTFLNVLADQLKKLSCSAYFKISNIADMIGKDSCPTVRSSLVKSMVEVSREFASRSVNACRTSQSATVENDKRMKHPSNDVASKLVGRVESMIRWEESNHLIYVFHNQDIQTLSPMYRDKSKVPLHIKTLFETQMKKSMSDLNVMEQTELQRLLQRVARTNKFDLPLVKLQELSKGYALTPDNLLKMVLIMMRITAKVPVVIMGETGCGKTSLVRYLASICEVPFAVLNIHAGVDKSSITTRVMNENTLSLKRLKEQRWLFLDEINTSECIGLSCDIICHHKCNGVLLAPNLVIMGACNPYKLRTLETIHTAGLSGKVKTDDLSKLVYRVLPLPEMMVDFVWDFGSLSEKDELIYIERMIEAVFSPKFPQHKLLRDLISISQTFVRSIQQASCAVSLRDVYRCQTLVNWFRGFLKQKGSLRNTEIDTNAIILALAHCYHSRFTDKDDRKNYRRRLAVGFSKNEYQQYTETVISTVIRTEQEDILNRMDLPLGTAKNTALQENVFMIIVCILNKIPIFVVGKPGCSKSLAMQIIRNNLRGKDSRDDLFKTLPQLYCVSFQGSESSTSDGIIKVFEKADNYQKSNSNDDVLSVVILDEIGLAEISRFNPLKVLHSLLEPDGKSQPTVAVVGISNWSLDASKMNRGIHLSRPDMDEEELFETAVSISRSFTDKEEAGLTKSFMIGQTLKSSLNTDEIVDDLKAIAHCYCLYTVQLQFKNFHGLRDFYALVKYVAKKLAFSQNVLHEEKASVIMEGLQRNFSGLRSETKSLIDNFQTCLSGEIDCLSVSQLIKANIEDVQARHLMIITKGESVIGILDQILEDTGRTTKEIIFGSQFEEDLTDDYHYRILSRIILCMEQGFVLILKDLDDIYGSLYDMLNQNYTRIGKKNNCRVALGPYSNPFCHVSDTFRCIVLVDSDKIDLADPPFLNRFEKQVLSFADVLEPKEENLKAEIDEWLEKISTVNDSSFSKHDLFPYFNDELIVSLSIFSCRYETTLHGAFELCKKKLLLLMRPDAIIRLHRAEDDEMRMNCTTLQDDYFELPIHFGLRHLVQHNIDAEISPYTDSKKPVFTITCTYSNIHAKIDDELKGFAVQIEKLGAFKSEKQLSLKLQEFWRNPETKILIVQCHSHDDEKHIMLAKSLIEKYRREEEENGQVMIIKHVYLIIHLVGRGNVAGSFSQLNFLSGWDLLILENLESTPVTLPELCTKTLKQTIQDMKPLKNNITDGLFWAFTKIKYGYMGRNVDSITEIISKMSQSIEFVKEIETMILNIIENDVTDKQNSEWFYVVACDQSALGSCSFFMEALERYISYIIRGPLAKIIFKLEDLGALESFFKADSCTQTRRNCWAAMFHNENIFSIADVKSETGPECYRCSTPDVLLTMPFSYIFFQETEKTKDFFMRDAIHAKAKCDLGAEEELPVDVMNELITQQKESVDAKVPEIDDDAVYESLHNDYIQDFCNLVSLSLCSDLPEESRIEYMKWALKQKMEVDNSLPETLIDIIVKMHCCSWLHMPLFAAVLHLFDACRQLLDNADALASIQLFLKNVRQNSAVIEPNEYLHEAILIDDQNVLATPPSIEIAKSDFEFQSSDETKSLECDNKQDQAESGQSNEHSTESLPIEEHTHEEDQEGSICSKTTNETSETDDEVDVFKDLVAHICSLILPSEENMKTFTNIQQWLVMVRRILLISEYISVDSKEYQSVKICHDFASFVVFPQNIKCLYQLGNALMENDLGSEEVFSQIISVVKNGKGNYLQPDILRAIRQYLISCISMNNHAHAIGLPFILASMQLLTDNDLHLLCVPFSCAIQEEIIENEDVLTTILSEIETEENESDFIQTLDLFVTQLQQTGMNSQFLLLIVDIFQDHYNNNFDDSNTDLILAAGRLLQNETTGIKMMASVAYIKATILKMANLNIEDQETNPLLDAIDAVLNGLNKGHVHETVRTYLVKVFGTKIGLSSLVELSKKLSCRVKSLESIDWTEKYQSTCVENNPLLSLFNTKLAQMEDKCFATHGNSPIAFEKSLKEMFQTVKLTPNTDIRLFAMGLAAKEFYLPQHRKILSDTKMFTDKVFEVFCPELDKDQQTLLSCLLGRRNFAVQALQNDTQMPFQQYAINTILLKLNSYALCLGDGGMNSLVKVCLTKPKMLEGFYIPGFPANQKRKSSEKEHSSLDNLTLQKCICGQVMSIRSETKIQRCVFCGASFDEGSLYSSTMHTTETDQEESKGWVLAVDCKSETFELQINRGMSPLTCAVLQFFVTGSVYSSLALRFIDEKSLEGIVPFDSLAEGLNNALQTLWNEIKSSLNLDDYHTCMFLHRVIEANVASLFKTIAMFEHPSERRQWEKEFEKNLNILLCNKLTGIYEEIQNCDQVYEYPANCFEQTVREADCENEDTHSVHHLFRLTAKPTKADFISQLFMKMNEYPFLVYIIKNEDILSLPHYLYDVIQWHLTSVVTISYNFKRNDCLRMSVQEFHDKVIDKTKRKTSTARFKEFKKSWNRLCHILNDLGILSDYPLMEGTTKMEDCLLLDINSRVFKVLEKLVHIQNGIIEKALVLAPDCPSLQFMMHSRGFAHIRCTPIAEIRFQNQKADTIIAIEDDITNGDLVHLDNTWEDVVFQESHCELVYGLGKTMKYDFHKIEKRMAETLLFGKSMIDLKFGNLPAIIFVDELYKNILSLIKDFRVSCPQKPLPKDMEDIIKRNTSDNTGMASQMLSGLDMVLSLLKRTKCDPYKSLVDYINGRQSIIGTSFPTQHLPSQSILVCHVVDLHELLEEISAERLIEGWHDDFSNDLEKEIEEHFRNITSIASCESILKAIKRFVYRCLFMSEVDAEQQLNQFLSHESFWPSNSWRKGKLLLNGKEEDIMDVIPADVQVCHIGTLAKLLSENIEKQQQGEVRMDAVITSWKSVRPEKSSKVVRQKKTAKKLKKL